MDRQWIGDLMEAHVPALSKPVCFLLQGVSCLLTLLLWVDFPVFSAERLTVTSLGTDGQKRKLKIKLPVSQFNLFRFDLIQFSLAHFSLCIITRNTENQEFLTSCLF